MSERAPLILTFDVRADVVEKEAMPKLRMDLTTFVGELLEEDDTDFLKEGVRVLAQALIEAEASTQIGADLRAH